MDSAGLSLQDLLKLAAYETDGEKLRELVFEISRRYEEKERAAAAPATGVSPIADNFEIFSGFPDRNATWLETVSGLAQADDRMREVAAESPGAYFIFHVASRKVIFSVNNGPLKAAREHKSFKARAGG
jgi:hypothetical protein